MTSHLERVAYLIEMAMQKKIISCILREFVIVQHYDNFILKISHLCTIIVTLYAARQIKKEHRRGHREIYTLGLHIIFTWKCFHSRSKKTLPKVIVKNYSRCSAKCNTAIIHVKPQSLGWRGHVRKLQIPNKSHDIRTKRIRYQCSPPSPVKWNIWFTNYVIMISW
jgi:hypothetical protein